MSFTETLQSITGKLLADCTDQELYLALLELVRQKSADQIIRTPASASARIRGLKRGRFGCKRDQLQF